MMTDTAKTSGGQGCGHWCVFGLVGAQLFQHRVKYGADPDRPPPYLLWEQPRAFCERSPVQSSWLVSVVVQAREAIRQHL